MISQTFPAGNVPADTENSESDVPPRCVILVRYGLVPEVARFGVSEVLYAKIAANLKRGIDVVVQADRGHVMGRLLEVLRPDVDLAEKPVTGHVVRIATAQDLQQHQSNRRDADADFFAWQERISNWSLQLQLVDLEWNLDRQQIVLYVLNSQDAETTRLALLAAAAGLGIIHVQPVSADGLVQKSSGGGCGSGGCGSGGCGS